MNVGTPPHSGFSGKSWFHGRCREECRKDLCPPQPLRVCMRCVEGLESRLPQTMFIAIVSNSYGLSKEAARTARETFLTSSLKIFFHEVSSWSPCPHWPWGCKFWLIFCLYNICLWVFQCKNIHVCVFVFVSVHTCVWCVCTCLCICYVYVYINVYVYVYINVRIVYTHVYLYVYVWFLCMNV